LKLAKLSIAVWLAVLMILAGCSWFQPKREKTAFELANEGVEAYNNGDYKQAIKDFERINDWYPFSKYKMLAELKVADSYFKYENYDDAITAYRQFENLHPQNDAIPYVIYQTGMCYYVQMSTVDRDQTVARKAMDTFERLVAEFPKNVYAERARAHIQDCLKILAGHDLYVGRFYFKSHHYKAALARFTDVITKYSDVGLQQQALQYIALCKEAIGKEEELEAKR
jgi:outer membrane protein assembly factor BamD